VAVTAYSHRQDRRLTISTGYSMHVSKPVGPAKFTAIIASLAGRPLSRDPGGGG
jgi:CheY-like chemotaxis protein